MTDTPWMKIVKQVRDDPKNKGKKLPEILKIAKGIYRGTSTTKNKKK